MAELWEPPSDLATRDLFHGPGGSAAMPESGASYTWVSTDTTGYSPGFEVRGADGRTWDTKLGPEAQSEVVASRVLWAIGYHQPTTYYVSSWQLSGGPGGQQQGARFRLDSSDAEAIGEWAWADNEFVGTEPYHGLIAANILINSWDWKTNNNRIYRMKTATGSARRFVVQDLGASFGRTQSSRLLWILPIPMRGFGQGTRNNIDDFESQRLHQPCGRRPRRVRFPHVLRVRRRSRSTGGRALDEPISCSRVTDQQWDDAFRAADYSPDVQCAFHPKDQGEDC